MLKVRGVARESGRIRGEGILKRQADKVEMPKVRAKSVSSRISNQLTWTLPETKILSVNRGRDDEGVSAD